MKLDSPKALRRVTLFTGVVVGIVTAALIADWVVAMARVAEDKQRVEALEAAVKTDAEDAEVLHDERDRQTAAELAREKRGRIGGWVLLVSGGVFVAASMRLGRSRPQPLPSLERLVRIRFDVDAPSIRIRPGASPGVADGDGAIDLAFVDGLVERHGTGREAAIPILQAIQTHYRYLPDEALRRVCGLTEISPAQIAGTSSFYAQFRRSPVGRHVVRVCHGTACHVAGADLITQELRRHLKIAAGEDTDAKRRFTVDAVACVGCCSLAPVMMVEEETAGRLTPAAARGVLDALEAEA